MTSESIDTEKYKQPVQIIPITKEEQKQHDEIKKISPKLYDSIVKVSIAIDFVVNKNYYFEKIEQLAKEERSLSESYHWNQEWLDRLASAL